MESMDSLCREAGGALRLKLNKIYFKNAGTLGESPAARSRTKNILKLKVWELQQSCTTGDLDAKWGVIQQQHAGLGLFWGGWQDFGTRNWLFCS